MKKNATRPPTFRGRKVILYPAVRRRPPIQTSRLAPYDCQIAALRAGGLSFAALRAWVQGQIGWKPSQSAIDRALARYKRSAR